ncbi:MAG: glycoside hydrolase family 16 protein [Thermoguttaceae bacterium]|nr:glycoside hydrolase family 16 protein [Thermoguttaceae bacterium]
MKRVARFSPLFAALAVSLSTFNAFAADASDASTRVVDSKNVPQTIKTSDGRELKLVWNDEFDGVGAPDPEKWGYEIGYIRNNEAQYYSDRLENVFQKDGALTIRTLKEKFPIAGKPGSKGRDFAEYTSGSINTLGKAGWLYGRVEVRARLPKGKGIWPAIWMMGTNIREVGWPRCGEIDIMEYVGKEPGRVYGTIHMRRRGAAESWKVVSKGNNVEPGNPEGRFCVYALEWTEDKLTILVDEEVVLEFLRSEEEKKTEVWPFDKPHYLLLNTAIGGAWGGEIADDTCPTDYQIDYVRVYQ